MSLQSILGVVIQACMAGIVFAKFTKPSHRGETIMFSKNALISLRNGSLYLLVRLADLRTSHLLAKNTTEEGEVVPYHLETLKFGSRCRMRRASTSNSSSPWWSLTRSTALPLSTTSLQKTSRQSSLRSLSASRGQRQKLETPFKSVRTSYLPSEILWGQRFEHT